MCKITLADGTTIGNLEMNGNNLISEDTSLSAEMFEGKLDTVTLQYEDEQGQSVTEEMHDCELVLFVRSNSKIRFVISEKSKQKKAAEVIEKALATDSSNIIDLQMAVVELYEMLIGE